MLKLSIENVLNCCYINIYNHILSVKEVKTGIKNTKYVNFNQSVGIKILVLVSKTTNC